MVFTVILSAIVFPLVGKLCDSIDPKKIVPFAFLFRAVATYFFTLLDKPDTFMAYAVSISIVLMSIFETIAIDSIYFKLLPKELRGVLNGIYSFMAQFGIMIYSLISGYLFDHVGPKSPFVFLGMLDVGYTFIFLMFVCCVFPRNE